MSAVHDTLRQAIASSLVEALDPSFDDQHRYDWSVQNVTNAVLAVVLADPTIRRWKAIADAVDDEPERDETSTGMVVLNSTMRRLRAGGEST